MDYLRARQMPVRIEYLLFLGIASWTLLVRSSANCSEELVSVQTYHPTPMVCCLPDIHILRDWLPLPSAWHAQAFLGNKQTKIKHRQREHEWDGNAQQWCIQNAKEYKQTRRGPDAMLLISCSHKHGGADRHTNTQRDDNTATGHGWLPRGPRAPLFRSCWVAPNLG